MRCPTRNKARTRRVRQQPHTRSESLNRNAAAAHSSALFFVRNAPKQRRYAYLRAPSPHQRSETLSIGHPIAAHAHTLARAFTHAHTYTQKLVAADGTKRRENVAASAAAATVATSRTAAAAVASYGRVLVVVDSIERVI